MLRKEGFIVHIPIKDEHGRVVGEVEAITYKGLLALAHEEGLKAVRTKLVQVPDESNGRTAIVAASVRTRKGVFGGVGDANPSNVNRRIAPHIIRMAETRAIARALRIAVNVGEVSLEELGEDLTVQVEQETTAPAAAERTQVQSAPSPGRPTSNAAPERFRGRDDHPTEAAPADRRAMTDEQKKLAFRLAYDLGESRETAAARVLDALKVERFEYATRADASRAIDALKRTLAQKKGNGKSNHGDESHAA